jgi:hypothetical protein
MEMDNEFGDRRYIKDSGGAKPSRKRMIENLDVKNIDIPTDKYLKTNVKLEITEYEIKY